MFLHPHEEVTGAAGIRHDGMEVLRMAGSLSYERMGRTYVIICSFAGGAVF